ncbi:hypothetical protein TNCV_1819961 [Trichonephila clavipes]|nr:hypothetical protein TNCV_1819961 [Trichonephila clavipes]
MSSVSSLPPHTRLTARVRSHERLVLQSACLVRWFLTENRKMNKQKIKLKFCFKLGKTPKETYAILVRVDKDQALPLRLTGASGTTLKLNGKAGNDVLIHHLVGKRPEQKNYASK